MIDDMIHINDNAGASLLEARNVSKIFKVRRTFRPSFTVNAVRNVTLSIERGETFGLVGESGCGKSTLGRLLTRLYEPDAGQVFFDGKDISHLKSGELAAAQRRMQMVFQDPYSSLNPSMRVEEIIMEPLLLRRSLPKSERSSRITEILEQVGLTKDDAHKRPHEFSGGQRQRVSIARALVTNPSFILCDEPISALDVSIQAQIVNLLEDLRQAHGLTYLFVAHDLSMVRYISSRIAVMYMGSIVELADPDELFHRPLHPYTRTLLSAIPLPSPKAARAAERIPLQGEPPGVFEQLVGCAFVKRCAYAMDECGKIQPELSERSARHLCACHLNV